MIDENEILRDSYPVHFGFYYLADGAPKRSPVEGCVADFKKAVHAEKVTRCDIIARGLYKSL